MNQHLRIWEISLLFALCVTLCTGLLARAEQQQLASELVRLHVIANSDSESDQNVKLNVRDSVLKELTPKLDGISDINEAQAIINKEIPFFCQAARQCLQNSGKFYSVSAKLCVENYPTREYDGFALPAGNYISLQIILGEGKGHNWWCVVFPPLCMASVEDEDIFAGLSNDSAELISSEENEYKLKFRIVELYGELRQALS